MGSTSAGHVRAAARAWRHAGLHQVDEFAGRPIAPLGQEVRAGQLRPFPPAEIRRVARGTLCLVSRPSGRGLASGVRSRWMLRQQSHHTANRSYSHR